MNFNFLSGEKSTPLFFCFVVLGYITKPITSTVRAKIIQMDERYHQHQLHQYLSSQVVSRYVMSWGSSITNVDWENGRIRMEIDKYLSQRQRVTLSRQEVEVLLLHC